MANFHKIKKKIIKNLEEIFKKSIANENFRVAIQAQKELIKIHTVSKNEKDISLKDLSEQQIKNLIFEAKKKLHQ